MTRGGAKSGRSAWSEALIVLAAMLISTWVLFANGRPLFYYDSPAYLRIGGELLNRVGLRQPVSAPAPSANGGAAEPADAGQGDDLGAGKGRSYNGTRSLPFSVLMAFFASFGLLEGLIVFNAATAVLSVWLAARVAVRQWAPEISPGLVTLAAVAAASLGSMSFYVVYLMPDIFTAVMLLSVATLTAFAPVMRPWELLLAFVLGAGSVVTHLSHQGIAILLLPLVLVLALVLGGRRRLLAPLLVAGIILVGFGQQSMVRVAAKASDKSEVIFLPFLTARLIADGVGYDYLEERCPDPALATCALYDALQLSDDSYRLTASHILFEKSPRLGSFRLMDVSDQERVAREQFDFFLAVLKGKPVGTALAFLANTLEQAQMTTVEMTLPNDEAVAQVTRRSASALTGLGEGRLTRDTAWLDWATPAQRVLYLASLAAILAMIAWPGVPGRLRVFLLAVLAGILVNALVCGGVSQPAARYGARAIWLLPAAAVLGAVFLVRLPALRRPRQRLDHGAAEPR